MKTWFTLDQLDLDTHIISEYRHWEETHCYLIEGDNQALLIDTGLGICDISKEVRKLTDKPVIAVATHIHWDHIGGHKYFPNFYAHEAELNWLSGEFPLNMETIREMVIDRCDLPEEYDVNTYEFFQGTPARVLHDGDTINLGGRVITVLHTPGHSPGHMSFWEEERGYLFTGDLVYKDTLFAYYPSTDPQAYLNSLDRIAGLPVMRVLPAHHTLEIQPEILIRMRDAFRQLDIEGKLHHGSGNFNYGDWGVWL
ncbi:glyoxylase-like metal-dependent hydrolase (beta-lactamase superfamily II) [Kineothrix alysoides]|uniref:Glyoxylase-like metal-dependent hydrolase (Beta-lactamase superfamily II) n=1 Tax=Kineothrix alysoides TaxID=1469948 RepID=A0A4R1QMR4_9FIRM|nr:MBL fold metallo-hydrolase [Kineothrix alysoides]TCL55019.1 glyoxylase-like metal-dependent hydrolase (beta-lactamase superfamily II) [Kineothrix alysoides]